MLQKAKEKQIYIYIISTQLENLEYIKREILELENLGAGKSWSLNIFKFTNIKKVKKWTNILRSGSSSISHAIRCACRLMDGYLRMRLHFMVIEGMRILIMMINGLHLVSQTYSIQCWRGDQDCLICV